MLPPRVVKLGGMALDLLFPQSCIGCGKEGALFCGSCICLLPRLKPPLCPRCGKPEPDGKLCSACAGGEWAIDGIRSPFRFMGVIREAIHQLKYQNLRVLALPLARLVGEYYFGEPVPGDVLVPVPLHQKRLRERGYNQSTLLARELSHIIRMPLVEDCLIRNQYALSQTKTLAVEERRSNVARAFTCRNRELAGKEVLLVDDVATSGATLNACAAALKAAGAVSVWGLAIAQEI